MKKLPVLFFFLVFFTKLSAQDTLPKFAVKNVGNDRIIVGWINNFIDITQISVQRSFDSVSGFKTINTVTDPYSPQNGFVDTKPTNDHMFYRLYMMKEDGSFQFTEAKRPIIDSFAITAKTNVSVSQNKDTASAARVIPGFLASNYVYTDRLGYVNINLPDEEKPKKYGVKFYTEEGEFIFEIKEVKERNFKIDKTNFYHAGWFRFELFEDGKLLEKHKFYIEKDF